MTQKIRMTAKSVLLGAALLMAPALLGAQPAAAKHDKSAKEARKEAQKSQKFDAKYDRWNSHNRGRFGSRDFDRDRSSTRRDWDRRDGDRRDWDRDRDGWVDSRDRSIRRDRHHSEVAEDKHPWRDRDGDGVPNIRDRDIDGDGVPNGRDDHPYDRRRR